MRFPKYGCPACGRPFSRKWNSDRHIKLVHEGVGESLRNWNFEVDEHRHGMNKQGPNYLELQTEEFMKEIARVSARNYMNRNVSLRSSFATTVSQNLEGGDSNIDNRQASQTFGFRVYLCENCLSIGTRSVEYDEEGHRLEHPHICDPIRLNSCQEVGDRSSAVRSMHSRIPELLKQRVSSWTLGMSYIIVKQLTNPPQELIKLSKRANPMNPYISLKYSDEAHGEIFLERKDIQIGHYVVRALRKGITSISEEELKDFLLIMKSATFGTLKINSEYDSDLPGTGDGNMYFVYIATFPIDDDVIGSGDGDFQSGKDKPADPGSEYYRHLKESLSGWEERSSRLY